jgi:O-antigen ligase
LALPVSLYLKRKYNAVSTAEISALIVVETALLAFTGARVGFIILPLLLLIMLLYTISLKRKIIAMTSLLFLSGVIIIGLLCMENQFTNRFEDPVRVQLWETAMASIKEKPLFGVGTGGMYAVIETPEMTEKIGQALSYPHIQYLGEIMHFGFIGATALFGTLIYLLILALRRMDFLLQSLLLILFVFMFTEMPLDSHKGINFFLFFTSLFVVTFPLRANATLKSK